MKSFSLFTGMHAGRRLALWLGAVLFLGIVLAPSTALAHAKLRKSDPGAKSIVKPPEFIKLWFSEQPERALTRIVLLTSKGAQVAIGPVMPNDDETGAKVQIFTPLEADTYTVQWHTVGIDGHPSDGTFTFRVLAKDEVLDTAFAAAADASARAEGRLPEARAALDSNSDVRTVNRAATPMMVLSRFLSFASIVLLIGAFVFRVAVLSRVRDLDAFLRAQLAGRLATGGAVSAALFIVFALIRLATQQQMAMGGRTFDAAQTHTVAMDTLWGLAWRYGAAAGVVALIGFLIARRAQVIGWSLVGLASVVICIASALTGHASAVREMTWIAVGSDALHVLAVSGWMGGLFWLATVALPFARRGSEHKARRAAALVSAFSPAAMTLAAVVVVTGVVNTKFRLGDWGRLLSTQYGAVLLTKLFFFLVVISFGFVNWRSVRRAMGSDRAAGRMVNTARAEMLVGFVVLLVTAILVGMPMPASM